MTVARPAPVTAFVDWNSQIHARPRRQRNEPEPQVAEATLNFVSRKISNALIASANSEQRFDVTFRLYHGWRKGFEETARRKAIVLVSGSLDFQALSLRTNISFRPTIEFGDNLISGRTSRLHRKLQCHVPNTLRWKINSSSELEEKMVDTAIASDVVDLARHDPSRWIVIVGDDDDLIPPALVADGIRGSSDGKVILLRDRPDTPFFQLHGLGVKP